MSGDVGIVVCPVIDTGCTAATKEPKLKEGRRGETEETVWRWCVQGWKLKKTVTGWSGWNQPRCINLSRGICLWSWKWVVVLLCFKLNCHSPSLLIRLNNSTCSRRQVLFQYSDNFACCWCNLGVCLWSSLPEKMKVLSDAFYQDYYEFVKFQKVWAKTRRSLDLPFVMSQGGSIPYC